MLQKNSSTTTLVPGLPERVFTRSGASIEPASDVWNWVDGVFTGYIDFRRYTGNNSRFILPLKHSLVPYLKGHSISHVHNLEHAFSHFLRLASPAGDVAPGDLGVYAAKLQPKERWRLSTLNGLLQRWISLGQPGMDPSCATYLSERRKPGNRKGNAVRTRDPIEGPLTEAEYSALYSSANAAYGRGDLPLWSLILMRLLLACGGRPVQFAALKIGDFNTSTGVLQLPLAKRRSESIRTSFVQFDIAPQTRELLKAYIANLEAQGFDAKSALFPTKVVMTYGPRKELRNVSDQFFGHCEPDILSNTFQSELAPHVPTTARLDFVQFPVNPKRFRYTFGTRLAEEGCSKVIVANRLGHTDLQNVDVYFSASPKVVENIDEAIGPLLLPLAQAFQGKLVEDEASSTQKGAPGSRIIDFRVSDKTLGGCDQCGKGCAFDKPIACYTCFRFEPFLDAPHDQVLERLHSNRQKYEHDPRLAAINDEAIRAVQEVMAMCEHVRQQRQQQAGASR